MAAEKGRNLMAKSPQPSPDNGETPRPRPQRRLDDRKVVEASKKRWAALQNDPEVVATELQGDTWVTVTERPETGEALQSLRLIRRDFVWVRAGKVADEIAQELGGVVVRKMGDSPWSTTDTGKSYLAPGRRFDGKEIVEDGSVSMRAIAAEEGWELLDLSGSERFNDKQQIIELRNRLSEDICFSAVLTPSGWDLGPFGSPTTPPIAGSTRIVRSTPPTPTTPNGPHVHVLVADSGLPTNYPQLHLTLQAPTDVEPPTDPDFHHGTFVGSIITRLVDHQAVKVVVSKITAAAGSPHIWEVEILADINGFLSNFTQPDDRLILNASFGGPIADKADRKIFDRWLLHYLDNVFPTNFIVVAAAGNKHESNADKCRPAGLVHKHIVTVGAATAAGKRSNFSNYGPWVEAWSVGVDVQADLDPSTEATWSGSSFATPIVSAVLADSLLTKTADQAIADMLAQGSSVPGQAGKFVAIP